MGQWELWSWSNGLGEDSIAKFPKLRELRIRRCPMLVGKLPTFLPSLEELDIDGCPLLVDLPKVLPSLLTLSIRQCQEVVLRSVSNTTSITTLKIVGVSGLVRLDEAHIKTLGSLEVLEIWNCDKLRCLWADGINSNYLTNLKRLEISNELRSGLSNLKSLKD
ncbi:hypothetical protein GH714_017932 [Hevea brasiliensis]|uniref:Disease resistance protein At4g27190-like leucine-rich repeats domain-containing protein n=1 Tax=Hevea brasiliensis TaxID=3981 RepID=A0A6A6N0P6_HEVBR|nr:hypothetical protein GH714_017932 [Hevea brasiliensis]